MADHDDDDRFGAGGLSSLIRMTGVEVPARAKFIGGAIVSASLWSITIGITWGAAGAVAFPVTVGPLVPYLVGSSVGYTFGLFQTWALAKRRMIWYSQQFPTVLAHALKTDNQIIVPASVMRASASRRKDPEDEDDEGVLVAGGYSSMLPTPYRSSLGGGPVALDQWILQGGLGRITWAILAAQACHDDVTTIQRQQRQTIVDRIGADLEES